MRTSRVSKESARLWLSLSPVRRPSRRSRASKLNEPDSQDPPVEEPVSSDDASLSSVDTVDMEDILERPAKRRKGKAVASTQKSSSKTITGKGVGNGGKSRTPRKVKDSAHERVDPPADWERIYGVVKKMRENNPTAPVDTMGCAELYWRASSPRDRRFHILIALMLSSQTKDTVTAVAMQRLHTELEGSSPLAEPPIVKVELEGDDAKPPVGFADSKLNLENILAVSSERLNELIRTVGFHNNKTKYIKAVAPILRDQYGSDIPATAKDLMALPGVGPKMAYLCMSAAWERHDGIGVDVHVHRITNLWGWHNTKTPEETRAALESWLPKDKWYEINKLLVGLGQTVCLPVGRRCGECDLAGKGLCKGELKNPKAKNTRGR